MKVGDRVVYIGDGSSLKKNSICTIMDIMEYSCGCVGFDVGIKSDYKLTGCPKHGLIQTMRDSKGCEWIYSESFRPIQYNSAHAELVNIVEEKLDIKQPEKVEL